jgi:hypothetical protein
METKQRWQDWVNLFLGIWLFITPFFGVDAINSVAAWNGYIFGGAVVVFSIWALSQPQAWEEWINFVLGAWLILAPFFLRFAAETAAMWNHIIVGAIICLASLWATLARPKPMTHA